MDFYSHTLSLARDWYINPFLFCSEVTLDKKIDISFHIYFAMGDFLYFLLYLTFNPILFNYSLMEKRYDIYSELCDVFSNRRKKVPSYIRKLISEIVFQALSSSICVWEGQYLGTNSIDLAIQAMKPFRNSD